MSHAFGVSADGAIVAGRLNYEDSGERQAFRWSAAEGIVGLGHLAGASLASSYADDVSADGYSIVGGSASVNSLSEAFLWTATSGMIGLGDLPGGEFASVATGISANGGIIVGEARSSLGPEAFRWTFNEGMVPLGDLDGGFFGSGARAISADGSTVVGRGSSESSAGSLEAFRWTAATGMAPLGDLPGGEFISDPLGISADGTIVLGYSHRAGGYKAFTWDAAHGMRDLQEVLVAEFGLGPDVVGWRLIAATDISDDGLSIVGYGENPHGNFEAWLVRLDHPLSAPEPSAFSLLLLASLAVTFLRTRPAICRFGTTRGQK